MAALGLSFGQFAIGANTYVYKADGIQEPDPNKVLMVHEVALSTVFPTIDLGYGPMNVGATTLLDSDEVDAFTLDVLDGSAERKFSWHDGHQEVYVWILSGVTTPPQPFDNRGERKIISCTFRCTRSTKHKASDDSIIWGD